MKINFNAKAIKEMAKHEPVESFIGLAVTKFDVESFRKEYGDAVTVTMIRRLAWYYKLRASGMNHEMAYFMSNTILFTEKMAENFKVED